MLILEVVLVKNLLMPLFLMVGGSQKGGFQKGGFGGCSPGTKTGTRVRSPKPPFYETALLSPSEMGCFPVDFQDVKRPLGTKSVKRPIKVGKRPINEGKRPIKAKVLVGVSVGSLMGCFRAPPTWRKTVPLKRPIKRSMIWGASAFLGLPSLQKCVCEILGEIIRFGV